MEKQSQPKLRFPEFNDKWEIKKLEDIGSRGSGHTPNKKFSNYYDGDIKWISLADSKRLDKGLIFDTEYKISEDGIKNSSAVLHASGTVLLSRDAGIGKSAVMNENMAVSQHFITWTCDNELLNNWFLYYKLQILKPEFERIAIGTTIKTIGLPYFKKLKFEVPSINEQQKIADYLTTIDKKIELLEDKKTELSRYKKAMMQKLFAQEIRFKDENGNDYPEWGVKKINDLCTKMQSGGTPTASNRAYYENGDIPFLSISDMTEQGKYLTRTKKYINDDGLENSSSWLVPKDSIIYSMYASVGFVSINKIEISTSQAVMNIILKSEYSIDYVYYFLNYFRRYIPKFIETGTQGNINAEIVKNIKVPIPCIPEQQKIADFLSVIDESITKVEEQIKETQNFKKAMLQQMFV